jgi:glycosyltransferase involved in cell wall biosynthesis
VSDQIAKQSNDANTAPRVSVILPAYNAAAHLRRAVDSALAQTMADLEIVIVDDASTDATLEIAGRIAARDSRVRVLHNERNSGPSVSRNRAIAAARGEWIAILDADDSWFPERLERMLADAGDADVVSDDLYTVRGALFKPEEPVLRSMLQEAGFKITWPRRLDIRDLVRYELALLKPIIRRSFLGRHELSYDPTLLRAHDFYLYFEILAQGGRWLQLPEGYYLYYKYGLAAKDKDDRVRRTTLTETVESNRALLDHPAAVGDKALIAALERRIQKAQRRIVFATAQDAVRQRRFADLARWLVGNPSNLLLITRFLIERLHLRVLWGVYRLRDPKPPNHRVKVLVRPEEG